MLLRAAAPHTARMQRSVLGKILLSSGCITDAELSAALHEQRRCAGRIGEVLVRRGLDEEYVARALAQQLGLTYADPPLQPEPAAIRVVERTLATRLNAVPLRLEEKRLAVALCDPLDLRALEDLEFQTGKRVQPLVASRSSIQSALAIYDADSVAQLISRLPAVAPRDEPDIATLERASQAPPIVSLVDHLLARATMLRASDLHLEPSEQAFRVRARVDGVLIELLQLPVSAAAAIVSRIKILAGLDISVKRKPQDGRASARIAERTYALRVSTLPTQSGEKIVIRLLDPDNVALKVSDLGMSAQAEERFLRMLAAPHGMVLVTGPTGSGKTTTLYAALAALDRSTRNIVTLEDPVEYRLPGITQVQVFRRGGITFASALRAVMRQDPDVIMVGELRDRETASVALAAAATGHLVLSTLHTNDAPGAVTRLFHLGVPPYLVAATLIGVVAQRLVRQRCRACRPDVPCGKCHNGLRGRTGLYEVLLSTPGLRGLVAGRAPEEALRQQALADGMQPLASDAHRLLSAGRTTQAEVQPYLGML